MSEQHKKDEIPGDLDPASWSAQRAPEAVDNDADTVPLKQLRDARSTHLEASGIPASGVDPYRTDESPTGVPKGRRRTLDDMRKLSEEIKRARKSELPVPAGKETPEKVT